MIKKEGIGYSVYDGKGKKKLGKHKTKKSALRQIAAVEISKRRKQNA